MTRHKYNDTERDFLRLAIGYVSSFDELTREFNKVFGTHLATMTLRDYCNKRLNMKINKNGGQFNKGSVAKSKIYPIGSEVVRNGYVFVKYNDLYFEGKSSYCEMRKNWKPKQRFIYECYNGEIPENEIIVFLDNDRFNFDIKNLYAVGRNIHAMMASRKWYCSEPAKTLAAIRCCELELKIKEK